VKSMVLKIFEGYVDKRGVLGVTSGAYPLAEDTTELVNAELSPMGLEVAIKTLDLLLSDEDKDAIQADAEREAERMLRGE